MDKCTKLLLRTSTWWGKITARLAFGEGKLEDFTRFRQMPSRNTRERCNHRILRTTCCNDLVVSGVTKYFPHGEPLSHDNHRGHIRLVWPGWWV